MFSCFLFQNCQVIGINIIYIVMYLHKPHASHCLFLINDNRVTYTHNFSRSLFYYLFSEQNKNEIQKYFPHKMLFTDVGSKLHKIMHNSYLFSSNNLLFGSSTNHFDMNFLEFLNLIYIIYNSKAVVNSSIWLYVYFNHISIALNLRYDPFI